MEASPEASPEEKAPDTSKEQAESVERQYELQRMYPEMLDK